MKKVILILCLIIALSLCPTAFAASELLTDDADLLEQWEEDYLTERLEEIYEDTDVAVIVVTVNSLNGESASSYSDDLLRYGTYGSDSILLLIDMGSYQWHMTVEGDGAEAISDTQIDSIGNLVAAYLSSGDYYDGFSSFADSCESYIRIAQSANTSYDSGYDYNYETDQPLTWLESLGGCLVIGFVASLIVVLIMKAKMKSVRAKSDARSYVKAGSMTVTQSYDMYLYSNTIRTAKPKNNGSSGRRHGGGRF